MTSPSLYSFGVNSVFVFDSIYANEILALEILLDDFDMGGSPPPFKNWAPFKTKLKGGNRQGM